MASNDTTVSLADMKAAENTFQEALGEVNSSYSNMASQIDALRSSWSGEAASTFQSAMDTWLQDFATVRKELSLMLDKLQSTTGSYANTHQTTTESAAKVRQGMSGALPGF